MIASSTCLTIASSACLIMRVLHAQTATNPAMTAALFAAAEAAPGGQRPRGGRSSRTVLMQVITYSRLLLATAVEAGHDVNPSLPATAVIAGHELNPAFSLQRQSSPVVFIPAPSLQRRLLPLSSPWIFDGMLS